MQIVEVSIMGRYEVFWICRCRLSCRRRCIDEYVDDDTDKAIGKLEVVRFW